MGRPPDLTLGGRFVRPVVREPDVHSAVCQCLEGSIAEANAHVTHVLSVAPQAARQLIVGLLDTLDVLALDEDDVEQAGRG